MSRLTMFTLPPLMLESPFLFFLLHLFYPLPDLPLHLPPFTIFYNIRVKEYTHLPVATFFPKNNYLTFRSQRIMAMI